ncbi:MAG: dihydroorotase family protein [Candidatus Bathyarchaeia archaeon]
MTVDLILKEAKIYIDNRVIEAGIAINEGRIFKVAKEANLPSASEKINLSGMLVLPGVIDVHVHLRDQELSYKEDFYSGTCAAANGGVTLVVDMPNNKPITMSSETLRERMEIASRKIIVNVSFYSAFPQDISEIKQIIRTGAKAFKIFLSHKVGGLDPNDEDKVISAFKEVASANIPIAIHAEDGIFLRKKIEEIGNRDDIDAYLEVHSVEAEVRGIMRTIRLMRESGACVHICHVSTSEGLKAILREKARGLPVSCEVTPHHLLLSKKDLKKIGNIALVNPPLRPLSDVSYLQWALGKGLIDIVASDHAPHSLKEKDSSSVWDVMAGIPGIETTLPLMLTMVNRGQISLSDLVRVLSENPSRIFGFKDRGQIAEGFYADLVVVDLKREWTIDSSEFYSKAKFSPFDGWRVKGKPVKTFVNGTLVMDEGEIAAKPGDGKIIGWVKRV